MKPNKERDSVTWRSRQGLMDYVHKIEDDRRINPR